MAQNISRRFFLTGSALAGAGIIASGTLAGCSFEGEASKPAPSEFFECEVLVCGTGTSGLCAASRAAELGAKVLCIDALTENGLGGNSKYVEACWRPASEEVIEGSYADMMDYHKNAANAQLVRRFCNEALDVFEWSKNSQGVHFADEAGIESALAKSPAIKYAEDEEGGVSAGKFAILTMYEYCKKLGVEFAFDCRAVELVADDGSNVVKGALCERRDGTRVQIAAQAVVLGTGGFSANKELFEEFTHYNYDSLIPYGTSGSQRGDAINMGRALGAALHHPEAISFCSPVLPGHFNKSALVICGCNQADTMFVNEKGVRFCDESCISDWALSGLIGAQQKHIFVVVDQDFVKKIETEGPVTKRTNYFKANEPVPEFGSEIEEALARDNPRVVKADTIAELAEALEIDPQALQDTVSTWNGEVDAGIDKMFQKDPKYMRKVENGPFYGFKTVLAWYNSVGGLKVDTDCRVIGSDFEPIHGLYAAGSDAGGLFGSCYDVVVAPASCQAWARASGKWAAEHAVNTYLPSF
ncbi:FAD-dependent oxidoreductase [Arabiibacter massiliensis]|uniref:FAD-dependent oxidoreductase n=1 Tax=Arabiibacter massiliensis TaxID=1870985 RepID=UPI00155A25E9|nr:FAD-binding protein [Arabiibacter massiliensis]